MWLGSSYRSQWSPMPSNGATQPRHSWSVVPGSSPYLVWANSRFRPAHWGFIGLITSRNEVVAKVMFLQVCVCPQGGGCLPQCMLGCQTPPEQADTPQDQADTPDQSDTPGPGRPPQTRQTPSGTRQTPPREAASSIRSTSGRYASHWNAFLFTSIVPLHFLHLKLISVSYI